MKPVHRVSKLPRRYCRSPQAINDAQLLADRIAAEDGGAC